MAEIAIEEILLAIRLRHRKNDRRSRRQLLRLSEGARRGQIIGCFVRLPAGVEELLRFEHLRFGRLSEQEQREDRRRHSFSSPSGTCNRKWISSRSLNAKSARPSPSRSLLSIEPSPKPGIRSELTSSPKLFPSR